MREDLFVRKIKFEKVKLFSNSLLSKDRYECELEDFEEVADV